MLSAVITALLIGMMLLLVANLTISILRARRRHRQVLATLATQAKLPTHPLDPHVTMILHIHEGAIVAVEKPEPLPTFTLSSSWYTRHHTLVSLCFLLMLFLALFMQSGLADGPLQSLSKRLSIFSAYQSTDFKTIAHPLPLTASVRLVRVDSAARDQYYNDYQWHVWSYASCSGISLEEVMNAYGRHLIAADVLQVEQNLGVWDTYDGLIGGEPSMAKVAGYFGFKADPHPPRTLQALIYIANKGFPVIVGIPGHIFVVRGGDSSSVFVADSAPANRTVLSYQEFMALWDGFSVLLTPQQ
jgi:hypothetical protein